MPTFMHTVLPLLPVLCALLPASDAHALPASFSLSSGISVTFDKAGTFAEEYRYDNESDSHYSRYFSFPAAESSDLHVLINFNGYIPVGKQIALILGGSILPTVYPEEFKWVFSEPSADIIINGEKGSEKTPDGVSIPLMPLPTKIDLVLKTADYEPGRYKACINGDRPFCDTYSAEDLGILYVGVGYSITPVSEISPVFLAFSGALVLAMRAARRLSGCKG